MDLESPALPEKERKATHMLVAKALYLAMRGRPDILTVVSFLCTRVKFMTKEDKAKLDRLI